jgi:hypothetical protein
MQIDHFINLGYGWMCKHCNPAISQPANESQEGRARFLTEGEAEDKETRFSSGVFARWRDASRQALVCPHCGIEELISKK